MPKPNRGGKRSGFGPAAKEIDAPGGKKIDLSKFPLRYGKKDTFISPQERAAVDAFEAKRYKNKVEYGTLITVDGKILIEKKGSSSGVSMPTYLYNKAATMSHNHPRTGKEAGLIGGTFSPADIDTFESTKVGTMRATALEGTYSITKTFQFDGKGFQAYYNAEERRLHANYIKAESQAAAVYRTIRKTTPDKADRAYREYRETTDREFNRYLVELHNALLKGQKQYGYSYTLERR